MNTQSSVMERVWAGVDRSGGPDACWPWVGARVRGYGQMRVAGGRSYVPRLVLRDKLGRPIREGHLACHHCDNPPCCNPAHLYEGTAKTNSADMHERGRARTPLGARRPDVTVRHTARLRNEGLESLLVTTAEVADWRTEDRLNASAFVTRYADRLAHGDPLPEWVA